MVVAASMASSGRDDVRYGGRDLAEPSADLEIDRSCHEEDDRIKVDRGSLEEGRFIVADAGAPSAEGQGDGRANSEGQAQELPTDGGGHLTTPPFRSPLFFAENRDRYERQELIRKYETATGANLIIIIDQIFQTNMTILEELLFDCDASKDLHVLLASPGGDGETALRMVRSMQNRCKTLTVVVPDMAKSAATILCLGADRILMGPGGDLGPIDPQMILPNHSLVSAKDIVSAVDEAEERVNKNQGAFPLFASLLSDVNMLMIEQARSALERSSALMKEALGSCPARPSDDVDRLCVSLEPPLIKDPTSHSAVISAEAALGYGLPAETADPQCVEWQMLWALWTRYFALGCWPRGNHAIYEGRRASHIG